MGENKSLFERWFYLDEEEFDEDLPVAWTEYLWLALGYGAPIVITLFTIL